MEKVQKTWFYQLFCFVRFQVLTAASMMFRDHPWWWRQYAPLKRRSTIILHGSITQKTALNNYSAYLRTTYRSVYFKRSAVENLDILLVRSIVCVEKQWAKKRSLSIYKSMFDNIRKETRNQFVKAVTVPFRIKINWWDYKSTRHEN
jgi:hypothetical protein